MVDKLKMFYDHRPEALRSPALIIISGNRIWRNELVADEIKKGLTHFNLQRLFERA